MAYRDDQDLEFLGKMKSSDLDDLVFCITRGKDGNIRLTEELTSSDIYKAYEPDHHWYWELIAAEIQCFGANTVATMFRRGKGVLYREILMDVCDKLKVNYSKKATLEMIETNLLMKILTDALGKMSKDELLELAQTIGIETVGLADMAPQAMTAAFMTIFKLGGFKSYKLTVIIVNAVLKAIIGRGLTFGGNILLTKVMSILAGPIGWAITGAWTVLDVAGSAYRVTIPAVMQIIVLRQKYMVEQVTKEIEIV